MLLKLEVAVSNLDVLVLRLEVVKFFDVWVRMSGEVVMLHRLALIPVCMYVCMYVR